MVADKSAENTEGGGCAGASLFEGYISEQEYARQRGVSLRTCQRDRALRKSPPHCVLGKQVYYRISAVRAWLLQQERSFPHNSGPAGVRGRR
jgi:predicted metal-dependent hydrolase